MKNNFNLLIVVCFVFVNSCKPIKESRGVRNFSFIEQFPTLTEFEVGEMVTQYEKLKTSNSKKLIKQISMDAIVLEKIARDGDGIRFIFGAYPNYPDSTLVIIDVYNLRNNHSDYYNMNPIFNDPLLTRTRRLEKGYLCPMPETCPIQLKEPVKMH